MKILQIELGKVRKLFRDVVTRQHVKHYAQHLQRVLIDYVILFSVFGKYELKLRD